MSSTCQIDPRGVWVSPGSDPSIVAAVEAGGGTVTALANARAAVLHQGGPSALSGLHEGVEWLQLPSAGIDGYVAAGLVTNERVNTNASPAYADTVAEHVILQILAAQRGMKEAMRAETWLDIEIQPLAGSTVLIIGAGRIGRSVIARLTPFDVTIHASTRSGRAVPGAEHTVAAGHERDIVGAADVVVVAAPATAETRNLIDARFFQSMKSTAILVNVARGALVDTDALVDALDRGTIGAAALDVTEPEPLPDGHPLWTHPRALITPHIANTAGTSIPSLARLVRENVRRFLAGDELLGVVNPEAGY